MLLTGKMHNKGFTLIEIIIVVVIMGVSLAVIAPSMGSYLKSIEVKSAQRGITNILLQGRKKAITSGKKQVIEIGEDCLSYRFSSEKEPEEKKEKKEENADNWWEEREEKKEEKEIRKNEKEKYIQEINMEIVNKSSSEIIFEPDGTCSGLQLTLKNENEIYHLEVDKITGDISWGENQ